MTSFLVNPFERVKILCQVNPKFTGGPSTKLQTLTLTRLQGTAVGRYRNGLDCAREIIAQDGFAGFMSRGCLNSLQPSLIACLKSALIES